MFDEKAKYYQLLVGSFFGLLCCLGCGSNVQFILKPVEDINQVKVITLPAEFVSSDKTISIKGFCLLAPGNIDWIGFDPDYQKSFLRYSPSQKSNKKEGTIVAYDIKKNTVLWAKKSNANNGWIADNHFGVGLGTDFYLSPETGDTISANLKFERGMWDNNKNILVTSSTNADIIGLAMSARAGREIADDIVTATTGYASTPFYLQRKHDEEIDSLAALKVQRTLIGRNKTSGDTLWIRNLFTRSNEKWENFYNNKYFAVSDGIECVDLETGDGWYIGRPTSTHPSELTNKIVNITAGVVSGLSGGTLGGSASNLPRPFKLSSPPIVVGDNVFFGAKNKIISCEVSTGKILWETAVDGDLGVITLYSLDTNILAVFNGWQFFKNPDTRVDCIENPHIHILNKDTGEMISSAILDKNHAVYDCVITESSIFMLSPHKIYQFNHDLQLMAEIPHKGYGDFIRFMQSPDNNIFIRSTDGVLALTEIPIGIRWWTKISSIDINPKHAKGTIVSYVENDIYSMIDGERITFTGRPMPWREFTTTRIAQKYYTSYYFTHNYLWLQTNDCYICLDLTSGKMLLEIPLQNDCETSLYSSGWLHATSGGKHLAVNLNSP